MILIVVCWGIMSVLSFGALIVVSDTPKIKILLPILIVSFSCFVGFGLALGRCTADNLLILNSYNQVKILVQPENYNKLTVDDKFEILGKIKNINEKILKTKAYYNIQHGNVILNDLYDVRILELEVIKLNEEK